MNITAIAVVPLVLASMASACVKAVVKNSDDVAPAVIQSGVRAGRTGIRSTHGDRQREETRR